MQRTLGLISSFLLVLAATACSTSGSSNGTGQAGGALKDDPGGNNGTVKIQEVDDELEIPENDPHVGCKFQIEFRGFDQGDLHATWTLAAQPPSGVAVVTGPNSVFIGGDIAGGANDVDGVVVVDMADYDLSSFFKHPQQGYHIKLTVHAEGSQGNDTKRKVFWTDGCQPPPPPPPPPVPACGDGTLNEGEQCDDGNVVDNDGCSANCAAESPPPPPPPVPACGDGELDLGEECDDGNVVDGDECSSTCTNELPPPPPPPCDADAGPCSDS